MPCGQTISRFAMAAALAWPAPAFAARMCSPVRVMTYNIRLDLESDGANRWSARRDQFIGQIAFARPAVLGLQEVVAGQKADLEEGLPNYSFIGVARDDGKSAGEFSNLAVDKAAFRILSSGTFGFRQPPSGHPRGGTRPTVGSSPGLT